MREINRNQSGLTVTWRVVIAAALIAAWALAVAIARNLGAL